MAGLLRSAATLVKGASREGEGLTGATTWK